MSARRPIFNHLVAPIVGGPVLHAEAKQMLDAYRVEVLTEAAAELDRIADTVEARVAEHYGPASGIGPGSAQMLRDAAGNVRYMAGKDTREGESTQPAPTPIAVHWNRLVIHPDADPTDDTIVCCIAIDTRQPVALFLDDEHREALGLMLVDPNPDEPAAENDEPDAAPNFFQPGHGYTRQLHGSQIEFRVEHVATSPDASYRIAFGWRHYPGEGWMPSESDDLDGWTETAEAGGQG